jgi:predicted nucleic acid-binding protein
VTLTAPTVLEVTHGLARAADRSPTMHAALRWFTRLVGSDLVTTLALDAAAALVAGRLRAAHPTPPTGARRAGTRPDQRAGWVLDLQIAACAWTHGHALATDNRRDFDVIAGLIAGLYPRVASLTVAEPPRP